MAEKTYGDYLIPSERVLLEDWGIHIRRMWPDDFGAYLVGSALHRRDFRDVDVRVMLRDAHWEALFPGLDDIDYRHPLWSGICTAMSLWGQKVTGLPIDFQLQAQSKANEQHPGAAGRRPIGMGYHGYELTG